MKDEVKDVGKDKLFNFRPVFFVAVFLCLGIVFCYNYELKDVSARWLLCLIPLAAAPFFFCRTKERIFAAVLAIALVGGSFFCGFFVFSFQLQNFSHRANLNGEAYVTGRVVEKRAYGNLTGLVLDDLFIGEEEEQGRLIAYLPATFCDTVTLSDEILLHGTLGIRTVSTDEFSYSAKDIGEGLRYEMWNGNAEVTGHAFDLFLYLRTRAERVIKAGRSETPAAVTMAVLFGDTSGIEAELYENIRRGGIAHIFAVSGLHVGALFAFCMLLMKKTALRRLPKILRFTLVLSLLVCYAGICGFSSSVVRASVMCLVAYAAKLIGTRTDLPESLGLAAICILLFKPSALFEVGFQLSFAACLGIAFLTKPIGQVFDELNKLLHRVFRRKPSFTEKEREESENMLPLSLGERAYRASASFLSVSLAAQIFTAPMLLYYFGYVSGWALLLNCIFVPLISGVFSVLLLLVVIACLLPMGFAFVIFSLPNVFWSAILLVFEAVDFSSFALTDLHVTVGACLCYYTGCIFCTDKWNMKKGAKRTLSLLAFLAFVAAMVALNV